jgi:hypothetical protein
MGQATLDLPDPTLAGPPAAPLSPEALASADDLLSQLAGDDIDRLLAEAEAERPAAVAPTTAPSQEQDQNQAVVAESAPAPLPAEVALSNPADPVEKHLGEPPAEVTAASAEAAIGELLAPAIDAAIAAPASDPNELPAALTEPGSFEPPDQKILDEAAAHVAAIMEPPPAAEAEAPAAVPVAASPADAATADAAEREALSAPLVVPPPPPPALPVRLLIRVLELINWPMTLVSDEAREAMGKIAIVTTLNAAAVLVYVLVFRRHHH